MQLMTENENSYVVYNLSIQIEDTFLTYFVHNRFTRKRIILHEENHHGGDKRIN